MPMIGMPGSPTRVVIMPVIRIPFNQYSFTWHTRDLCIALSSIPFVERMPGLHVMFLITCISIKWKVQLQI